MQLSLDFEYIGPIQMPDKGWPTAGYFANGVFYPMPNTEGPPDSQTALLSDVIESEVDPRHNLTPKQLGKMIEKLQKAIRLGYARPDNRLLAALLKHQQEQT